MSNAKKLINFLNFKDSLSLESALADRIIGALNEGIKQRGRASCVVSGGTTPIELFKRLSQYPIEWDKVDITLADERWVDPSEEASNEKLVRTYLLRSYAEKANFIGLKNSELSALAGEKLTTARLQQLILPFDIVILGMGEDGHTASLFPSALNLADALAMESDRLCMGITPRTAPFERITLTLFTLLQSKQIVLHLVGDKKLAVYQQAMLDGPVEDMPVRAVIKQNVTPITVFWSP